MPGVSSTVGVAVDAADCFISHKLILAKRASRDSRVHCTAVQYSVGIPSATRDLLVDLETGCSTEHGTESETCTETRTETALRHALSMALRNALSMALRQ